MIQQESIDMQTISRYKFPSYLLFKETLPTALTLVFIYLVKLKGRFKNLPADN